MKVIEGNVTAAKGFKAGGIHCGVKSPEGGKKDLAMILSQVECTAAATYTRNKTKADPLYVSMAHLEKGKAWGIICNSGNANACAPNGKEHAIRMCQAAAAATGHKGEDFAVASTGVIGQELNIQAILSGIPSLAESLSVQGGDDAASAIMTTDLKEKAIAVEMELGGKTVRLGGIAKGSGMIHPNMGTMLCFLTTDAAISHELLQKALREAVRVTFNRVSVDGDTSTNDMCCILANGLGENQPILSENEDYRRFMEGLAFVCRTLARAIAADGEGASRLVTCIVQNARDEEEGETVAKAVIASSLVKAAMFGADANWGRVLCAAGYSGADCHPENISVAFSSAAGRIPVCEKGKGLVFDEDLAKKILLEKEVTIEVDLNEGKTHVEAWGCDLSYEYVRINGDYRS